jgi:hypothetical protein
LKALDVAEFDPGIFSIPDFWSWYLCLSIPSLLSS